MTAPLEALQAPGATPARRHDDAEQMAGWGVMGLPFEEGHILALRVFPSSSLGQPYRSVWHRDPAGLWRMWVDAPPRQACPRYFGRALIDVRQADIDVSWTDPWHLQVQVAGGDLLDWRMRLDETRATRLATWLAGHMPGGWWDRPRVLSLLGRGAGHLLGAGRLAFHGTVPNGQWFRIRPTGVWTIPETTAIYDGHDLGPLGPVEPQSRLGDLRIPQTGLFAVGQATFEAFDPDRHTDETVGMIPDGLVDPSGTMERSLTRSARRP